MPQLSPRLQAAITKRALKTGMRDVIQSLDDGRLLFMGADSPSARWTQADGLPITSGNRTAHRRTLDSLITRDFLQCHAVADVPGLVQFTLTDDGQEIAGSYR